LGNVQGTCGRISKGIVRGLSEGEHPEYVLWRIYWKGSLEKNVLMIPVEDYKSVHVLAVMICPLW